MRIIAGQFRGTVLTAVGKGDPDAHLRPTTDRVRENLFNLLVKYDVMRGPRVLDLFAGTGALGLEALSRGAEHVSFVEIGRSAQDLIARNIGRTRSADQTLLIRQDATQLGVCRVAPFDLVFLDPPYGKGLGKTALMSAEKGGWLAPDALIVWEEATRQQAPTGFVVQDARKYGDTTLTILQKGASAIG